MSTKSDVLRELYEGICAPCEDISCLPVRCSFRKNRKLTKLCSDVKKELRHKLQLFITLLEVPDPKSKVDTKELIDLIENIIQQTCLPFIDKSITLEIKEQLKDAVVRATFELLHPVYFVSPVEPVPEKKGMVEVKIAKRFLLQ